MVPDEAVHQAVEDEGVIRANTGVRKYGCSARVEQAKHCALLAGMLVALLLEESSKSESVDLFAVPLYHHQAVSRKKKWGKVRVPSAWQQVLCGSVCL
jgi:hypothetical protein